MKKKATIFGIMITLGMSVFSQVSKPNIKASSAASKKVHTKGSFEKPSPSLGVPANAFYYKSSGKTDTISASYNAIVIEGDNNKLHIDEGNEQLFIKGKNNDVTMKCADYIEITGDGNFVSWEVTKNPERKPVIKDRGGYNNVGKRSSGILNRSDN